MIARLIALSVRSRWMVLFLFLGVAVFGTWQLFKLPIDAVPDITSNQVQLNTSDPRLSPEEIEKLVIYPVELSLPGRSEEHTSEHQSLLHITYAVFCLTQTKEQT